MWKCHTYEIFPSRHSSALSLGYTSVNSLHDSGIQTMLPAVHIFANRFVFLSVRNYPVNQPNVTRNKAGVHILSKTLKATSKL